MDVAIRFVRTSAVMMIALATPVHAQSTGLIGGMLKDATDLKALLASRHAAARTPEAADRPGPEKPPSSSDTASGDLALQRGKADDTDLSSRPLVRGDLRTFDLGGFKIAMSPSEEQRDAAAHRLTIDSGPRGTAFDPARHSERGPTYQALVERNAAERLHRPVKPGPTVVRSIGLLGPDGDHYSVDFLATENGPRVWHVLLTTSPRGNSLKSIRDLAACRT